MRVLGKINIFSVYGVYFVLLFRVYVFIVCSIHFQVLFLCPGSLETAVTEGGGTHQYIYRCGAPTPPQKFFPKGRAAAIDPRVVPSPSPSSSPHPALKPRGHVDGRLGEDRKSACERERERVSDRTRERESE